MNRQRPENMHVVGHPGNVWDAEIKNRLCEMEFQKKQMKKVKISMLMLQ